MEDYSGSEELRLFGNDWIEWRNYFIKGAALYIRAKCLPRQWNPSEYELKISSIELMADVKENNIERLTITIPIMALNETFVVDLASEIYKHPGKAELFFKIVDNDGQVLDFRSTKSKISIENDLMIYLKSNTALDYKIN